MIARHRVSRRRSAGGLAAVAAVALAGFAVGGSRPADPVRPAAPALVHIAASAGVAQAPVRDPQREIAALPEETPAPVRRAFAATPAEAPDRPQLAQADPPAFAPDAFDAPAPAPAAEPTPAPAPAPAPEPRHARTERTRFVTLERLDPALRARVEAALAQAAEAPVARHGRAFVHFASAESATERTLVLRIRIQTDDQGE
jgi:hypothetical protein